MAIRPKLVTKAGGIVVSYHDASLFYATKGDGVDKLQESLPDTPYGIINSLYGQESLTLRFDEQELTCYLKPGVFHVYGRQIEITEELTVYDFHSTVESRKMFCTVYAEISLEDYTHQMVSIKLDIAGANFKNFKASGTQDDLYKLDHGVYQVPIARFTYTPIAETHFQDSDRVIPFLPDEAINNAKFLIETINNVPISTLMEMNLGVDKTTTGKFEKASNVQALEIYNSDPGHMPGTGGYSVAKEARKLGIGQGSTEVTENLQGLYTIKRFKIMDVSFIGSQYGDQEYEIENVQWDKLQFIRIWFSKGSFKCTINQERNGLFHDWESWMSYEVTCNQASADLWIKRDNSLPAGTADWKRFHIGYGQPGEANNRLTLWSHVWGIENWESYGYKYGRELKLTRGTEFDNCPALEDGVWWLVGNDTDNIDAKHSYGAIHLMPNYNKDNSVVMRINTYPYGDEKPSGFFNHIRQSPITGSENRGYVYIDFIYEGDVKKL